MSSLEKPQDFTIEEGITVFLDSHVFRNLEEDQFFANVAFAFIQGQGEGLVNFVLGWLDQSWLILGFN